MNQPVVHAEQPCSPLEAPFRFQAIHRQSVPLRAIDHHRQSNEDHSVANEIMDQDLNQQAWNSFFHDCVGNLRRQQVGANPAEDYIFIYDGWNRLTQVHFREGQTTRQVAAYEYNGLNWRTLKRVDTSPTPDGVLNLHRVMSYSANWQLLEESVSDGHGYGGFIVHLPTEQYGDRGGPP